MTLDAPTPIRGDRTALLGTEALRDHVAALLSEGPETLLVISAFTTGIGVEWLERRLRGYEVECNIVARWSANDLMAGASDVDACEATHAFGWRFHVLHDLHAKVMLIDDAHLVVGSANLTGAGMSLAPAANREFGIVATAAPEDIMAARGILADATEVTPAILSEVKDWLESHGGPARRPETRFPDALLDKFVGVPFHLYTAELPWVSAPTLLGYLTEDADAVAGDRWATHDRALLGLEARYATQETARSALREAVRRSRFWRWLVRSVRGQPGCEAWHGKVTAMLHDALLDDPRPYRRDVKDLVSNLYSLAAEIDGELVVDRPNWSQRLTYRLQR